MERVAGKDLLCNELRCQVRGTELVRWSYYETNSVRDRNAPLLIGASLLVLVPTFATAAPSFVDYICPLCEAPGGTSLNVAGLVDLVLSTLPEKGAAVLLVGTTATVGLSWLVAGVAVAVLYLPGRLRSNR